jgi:galactose-1-phosphate uridylyltransferase
LPARRTEPSADVRRDRLTGETTLVVPEWETAKAANPSALELKMPSGTTPCPFCPAQMDQPVTSAGEETARVAGGSRQGSWAAVSLLNRWPHTLRRDASEVVVLSDDHDAHLGSMDLDDASLAVGLLLERAEDQRQRGLHPLVFVNHGTDAGASQPHPHGQVIGLPVPDPVGLVEAPALVPGCCVLCEETPEDRLVARLGGASIITPEAPTVDYDQIVVPTIHGPAEPREIAAGVGAALRALWAVTGPVSYNLVLHLVEHPHVHVTPRTARHSGYELAGLHTCYIPPTVTSARLAEAATADAMREAARRSDAA